MTDRATQIVNALTVDVEDYYHVSAFERHISRQSWQAFDSRVEASTRRLLDILAASDTQGTFFILGWVAQRHPKLVREIHSAGHELGSHSFWHRLVFDLSP